MKTTSIWLIIILGLAGCASHSSKISNINKINHSPGHSRAQPYTKYTFEINFQLPSKIDSISIKGYQSIESWYYKDLSTGLSSTNKAKIFERGHYEIGFRVDGETRFNTKDVVELYYQSGGMSHQKQIKMPNPAKTVADK